MLPHTIIRPYGGPASSAGPNEGGGVLSGAPLPPLQTQLSPAASLLFVRETLVTTVKMERVAFAVCARVGVE